MRRRAQPFLAAALAAGCAACFASSMPLWGATSAPGDPFAALGVTRMAAGVPVAAFDLKALAGGPVRIPDSTGRVLVLNFWATWCGPCKEEMPSLARLQSQFDSAQVSVVTVTSDRYPQGIKQVLDQLGITLPVLFDEDEELSRHFMVRGLPTTVLLDRSGRTVGRAVGPRAWDSKESIALVRQVLEQKP